VTIFRRKGARTRRLLEYLRRRARGKPEARPEMDCKTFPALFRKRAIVFTDTADFTMRAARDGILHFLMVFENVAAEAAKVVRETGGDLVKVEGDSLLIRYDDINVACRGVQALEDAVQRLNRSRPENERLHFSYGVGYGDVLDLDEDVFGLEVNLASKLGEDLAEPGEALLTPAAAAAVNAATLKRLVPFRVITFGTQSVPVQRLKLRSRGRKGTGKVPTRRRTTPLA
jgi:class 3 adenylate cyclase